LQAIERIAAEILFELHVDVRAFAVSGHAVGDAASGAVSERHRCGHSVAFDSGRFGDRHAFNNGGANRRRRQARQHGFSWAFDFERLAAARSLRSQEVAECAHAEHNHDHD
jgi:hypothetical protein